MEECKGTDSLSIREYFSLPLRAQGPHFGSLLEVEREIPERAMTNVANDWRRLVLRLTPPKAISVIGCIDEQLSVLTHRFCIQVTHNISMVHERIEHLRIQHNCGYVCVHVCICVCVLHVFGWLLHLLNAFIMGHISVHLPSFGSVWTKTTEGAGGRRRSVGAHEVEPNGCDVEILGVGSRVQCNCINATDCWQNRSTETVLLASMSVQRSINVRHSNVERIVNDLYRTPED